jgi:hypothetical protein
MLIYFTRFEILHSQANYCKGERWNVREPVTADSVETKIPLNVSHKGWGEHVKDTNLKYVLEIPIYFGCMECKTNLMKIGLCTPYSSLKMY